MAAGSDLGVIGIIGIILLIGIVKKNAIMMIDFALDAERNEGKPPREAIHQACLLRLPADPDDDDGGAARRAAADARHRHGLRAAPPARHHHRRRPDRQPGADAVHHAGHLPLRSTGWRARVSAAASLAAARATASRRARRHEPLGALHPPAGRDHAAHRRRRARGRDRLLPAAGLAAAAGRLSDHLGAGAAARREPASRWRPASRRRSSAISARSPT